MHMYYILSRKLLILATALSTLLEPKVSAQIYHSVYFVVPADPNVLGKDPTQLPLVPRGGTARVQQIYDHSAFTEVPPEGAFLTRLFFRPTCNSQGGWVVTNLQVNISTSSRIPDQLDARFAANIGIDETTVYGPKPAAISTQAHGCSPPFDIVLELDNPFFYSPANGNLLLDIRNFGSFFPSDPHGGPQVGDSHLDAPANLGDVVSRIAASPVTAEVATVVDTAGLTTAFQFDPFPKLVFQTTNDNAIVLLWPHQPTNFRLQFTDRLTPDAVWQDYQGDIGGNTAISEVKLPADVLTKKRFFRLYWNSMQPGLHNPKVGWNQPQDSSAPRHNPSRFQHVLA